MRSKLGKESVALNFVKPGVGRFRVYVKGYKDRGGGVNLCS